MVERARFAALVLAALVGSWCMAAQSASASDPPGWRPAAIDLALEEASRVTDPYRRAGILADIARAQILLEDSTIADRTLQAALASAKEIAEPTFQGWALHEIVLVQIAAHDLAGAGETTTLIRAERPLGSSLAAIANMQMLSGNPAAAEVTAGRIRDDESAAGPLRAVVAFKAARGDLAAARQTLRRIDDDYYRAAAAGDIAVAQLRAGNVAGALGSAASAPRAERAQVYERMSAAMVAAGDTAGALEMLARIDDPIDRALVQARVAMLVANRDRGHARQLFEEAQTALERAPDKRVRKPVAWARVARMQAAAEDVAGARGSLLRASAALDALPQGPQRDQALDLIARARIRIGDSEGALDNASAIEDRVAQSLLVRDVLAAQADSEGAAALLSHTLVRKSALTQTAALFGVIGVKLLRKDALRADPQEVAGYIKTARASVAAIDDVQIRPAAFAALAAASTAIGQTGPGSELFNDALASVKALTQPEQRAAAYLRIVNALDERLLFLGRPANAAQDD